MYITKIKSIKKIGKIDTYDLQTPKYHNFFLDNGILSHNSTGSGKSYRDLRKAELWYQYKFNEPFPTENICFGVGQIMKLLSSGKLRKGELLIFEEAGVNLGSLDFQSKISKMMTYVLQSFRSMNIGILFNLPHLAMLNKQTRMLVHYSFESAGIDFKTGTNKCKPFFHQVNQSTGKIYKKYPKVFANGKVRTIKRFNFKMPSQYLRDAYEKKKTMFLADLTKDYTRELDDMDRELNRKMERAELTDKQKEAYDLACQGYNRTQIAKILKISITATCERLKHIKKKGYTIEIKTNPLEKPSFEVLKPNLATV